MKEPGSNGVALSLAPGLECEVLEAVVISYEVAQRWTQEMLQRLLSAPALRWSGHSASFSQLHGHTSGVSGIFGF